MTKAFDCSLRLLARREHGRHELTEKLIRKGHSVQESEEAVAQCLRLRYQSDERFVESFCNLRIRQGYGPLRIMQELQHKQINRELINTILAQYQDSWQDYALGVWRKKFNTTARLSIADSQKQQRFLLYRGFPAEIIAKLFKQLKPNQSDADVFD